MAEFWQHMIAFAIVTLFISATLIIMIIGAVCMENEDYDLCGSRTGSIVMVSIGTIVTFFLCFPFISELKVMFRGTRPG